ncbi:unnamed protein product, partial [Oikopleura dioica]
MSSDNSKQNIQEKKIINDQNQQNETGSQNLKNHLLRNDVAPPIAMDTLYEQHFTGENLTRVLIIHDRLFD